MLLNVAVLEQGPYGVSPSEVARVGPSPTRPRPHRRGLNAGRTPQRAGGQGRAGAGAPRRWHEGRRGHQSWERARRHPSPRATQDVAPRAPRPWARSPRRRRCGWLLWAARLPCSVSLHQGSRTHLLTSARGCRPGARSGPLPWGSLVCCRAVLGPARGPNRLPRRLPCFVSPRIAHRRPRDTHAMRCRSRLSPALT